MRTVGQSVRTENGGLVGLHWRRQIRVDLSDENAIQIYLGGAGAELAAADPADRSSAEGKRDARPRRMGLRDGSLAPGAVEIAVDPGTAVDHGRIPLLVAPPRCGHIEGIHHNLGTRGR